MSEHRRRLAIIYNPTSAGGKPLRVLHEVTAELDELGLPHRAIESLSIEHCGEQAREASAAGEVVVALGGDGLVGRIAAALRGVGPMGVLPGGRGNDFARAVGIPLEIRPACRVLATGVERELDLGEANGKPFACIASIGYDSEANRIANETKLIRGNLVYAYAAFAALAKWKPVEFRVKLDGKPLEFRGYSIAIANTAYFGGGMKVAPNADPTDGMLDVVMINDGPKLRFAANMPRVFSGTHIEKASVGTARAHVVEVEGDRPLEVYADGDPLTDVPVRISTMHAGIRLIAP